MPVPSDRLEASLLLLPSSFNLSCCCNCCLCSCSRWCLLTAAATGPLSSSPSLLSQLAEEPLDL